MLPKQQWILRKLKLNILFPLKHTSLCLVSEFTNIVRDGRPEVAQLIPTSFTQSRTTVVLLAASLFPQVLCPSQFLKRWAETSHLAIQSCTYWPITRTSSFLPMKAKDEVRAIIEQSMLVQRSTHAAHLTSEPWLDGQILIRRHP